MTTLTEAIANGRGIERPFRCHEHDDRMASASVNVEKGLWFCFSCGARGSVDKNRVLKVKELQIMMEPEQLPRVYDESFLDLYSVPDYWLTRFPAWLCWSLGLGEDPFTGDATFPVHTGQGRLAGVGRRTATGEPKYKYPRHWSAASSIFGFGGKFPPVPALVLVEGAADATACWEVGCPALAVYGSGVHRPQYELIIRHNPKLVLLGFDMDGAGIRAAEQAHFNTEGVYLTSRVDWPENDPAACTVDQRRLALEDAVRCSGYRGIEEAEMAQWEQNTIAMQDAYQHHLEDQ